MGLILYFRVTAHIKPEYLVLFEENKYFKEPWVKVDYTTLDSPYREVVETWENFEFTIKKWTFEDGVWNYTHQENSQHERLSLERGQSFIEKFVVPITSYIDNYECCIKFYNENDYDDCSIISDEDHLEKYTEYEQLTDKEIRDWNEEWEAKYCPDDEENEDK
jgi:hypothetical protein